MPGQAIWRRRIQQYSAKSKHPYPLYDWTDQALREVLSSEAVGRSASAYVVYSVLIW